MDFVVSRIRVLQENFIETAPASVYDLVLGSGVPGPPSIRPKGGGRDGLKDDPKSLSVGDDSFMDRIYDPQSGSGNDIEGENEGKYGGNEEGGMVGMVQGQNEGGAGQGDIDAVSGGNTVSERDQLPVLTMETISNIGATVSNTLNDIPSIPISTSTSTSVSSPMPVTVVDDLPKILLFAAAVRKLSRQASSSGTNMEGHITLIICVVYISLCHFFFFFVCLS